MPSVYHNVLTLCPELGGGTLTQYPDQTESGPHRGGSIRAPIEKSIFPCHALCWSLWFTHDQNLLPTARPDRVFLRPPPLCCRFPASWAGQAQRTKVNTVPSSSLSPPPSPLCRPQPDGPLGPLASPSCFCSAGSLGRQTDSSSLSPGRLDWSRAVRPIYQTNTGRLLSNTGYQPGTVGHL